MVHHLLDRVPGGEVLCPVHPDAVGAEVDLAALHLQDVGTNHRVLLVDVLAVHVGAAEPGRAQKVQGLAVGVAVDHVQHEQHRFRQTVQGGHEVHHLVGTARGQQARVGGRRRGEQDVVAPVGHVRAAHPQRLDRCVGGAFVNPMYEPGTQLVLDRRLQR